VGAGLGTALFRLMLLEVVQNPGNDITIRFSALAAKYLLEVESCGFPVENSPEIVLVVLLKRYFY